MTAHIGTDRVGYYTFSHKNKSVDVPMHSLHTCLDTLYRQVSAKDAILIGTHNIYFQYETKKFHMVFHLSDLNYADNPTALYINYKNQHILTVKRYNKDNVPGIIEAEILTQPSYNDIAFPLRLNNKIKQFWLLYDLLGSSYFFNKNT